jgi:hypothetical protein
MKYKLMVRRIKFQIMSRTILIVLVSLSLTSCDRYHGFGCVAPEYHRAVAHARSLSAEQLKTAYFELYKLSDKYAKENYETKLFAAEIPNNLKFLNAEVIRVYQTKAPDVILANCFDERIELSLSPADDPQATITLHWAEPTNENPYITGNQILWNIKKN